MYNPLCTKYKYLNARLHIYIFISILFLHYPLSPFISTPLPYVYPFFRQVSTKSPNCTFPIYTNSQPTPLHHLFLHPTKNTQTPASTRTEIPGTYHTDIQVFPIFIILYALAHSNCLLRYIFLNSFILRWEISISEPLLKYTIRSSICVISSRFTI